MARKRRRNNNDNSNDNGHGNRERANNGSNRSNGNSRSGGGYRADRNRNNRNDGNTDNRTTVNRWRIREEMLGGRMLYLDGKFYSYGDELPKLRQDLFQELKDEGVIELADIPANIVQ